MFEVCTGRSREVIDITGRVRIAIQESGVENGFCLVSTRHTTTGLLLNEGEAGLIEDFLAVLHRIFPPGAGYCHDKIDNNGHAHLQASILNSSLCLPVNGGGPVLGTWQRILLFELDGPRTREIDVTLVSG